MRPLIEHTLKITICNNLRCVIAIEAYVELWAKAWIELGGAYGRIGVCGPFPHGQHLWIVGAQRRYVLGVGRDRHRNGSIQMRVEVGLNGNAFLFFIFILEIVKIKNTNNSNIQLFTKISGPIQ